MKNRLYIWIFIFLIAKSIEAQNLALAYHSEFERVAFESNDVGKLFFASDSSFDNAKYIAYQNEINALYGVFQKYLNHYSQEKAIEKFFYFVHRKQFLHYENYPSFSKIFDSGSYDCLTGTSLFALVLEEFGFDYSIIEFEFHIFLIVFTDTDKLLLESTDPLDGFVNDPADIIKRTEYYQKHSAVSMGSPINPDVSLIELVGLHYLNLAIKTYDNKDITGAYEHIQKASHLYSNPRIASMQRLFRNQLLLAVEN